MQSNGFPIFRGRDKTSGGVFVEKGRLTAKEMHFFYLFIYEDLLFLFLFFRSVRSGLYIDRMLLRAGPTTRVSVFPQM